MQKIFFTFLALFVAASPSIFTCSAGAIGNRNACYDLEVLFARGSGAEAYHSEVYYDLQDAFEEEYKRFGLTYRLLEVNYPAVAVANLNQIFEAYISAGRAYEFGASVETGVEDIRIYHDYVQAVCPDSKMVLIGYSQGAMVVKDAAAFLADDELGYLLTFGDPETYLPEGEGLFPEACTKRPENENLSRWRLYAPECRTYEGIFGGRRPYEPTRFKDLYALTCNADDFICGSSHNPFRNNGHTSYAGSGLVSWSVNVMVDAKLRAVWKNREGLTDRPDIDGYVRVNARGAPNTALLASAETARVSMRRIAADKVLLTWSAPPEAKYVLVRLNGVILGYVEASRGELEIRDLDYRVENRIALSWLSADGEVSETEEYPPPTQILPPEEGVEPSVLESEPVVKYDQAIPLEDVLQDSSPSEEVVNNGEQETQSINSDGERGVQGVSDDANNTDVDEVPPNDEGKNKGEDTEAKTLSYVSSDSSSFGTIVKIIILVFGAGFVAFYLIIRSA